MMEELKLEQKNACGDFLRAKPDYGGAMEIEVYEPWAGDTETGFGRGGTVRLTKEQALQFAAYLTAWATEDPPPMTDEIKPEDVKLPEPVACFVEPELGVMLWPIGDIHEARLYCDEGQEPGLLFTADQVRAAVLEERERAARACEALKQPNTEDTVYYNDAVMDCVSAIRSGHSITETKRAEE